MQMDIFVEFNICVNWCQFASDFFDEKDANHHKSRIAWPHPKIKYVGEFMPRHFVIYDVLYLSRTETYFVVFHV